MNDNSTEHIKNSDLKFIFDSILKKMTRQLQNSLNLKSYGYLEEESAILTTIMFNKFKIQFYSVMQLTYEGTHDPVLKYEYLDIASIHTIIRGCYETYLTFYYIYMMPESFPISNNKQQISDVDHYNNTIRLKLLLYKYEGYKQAAQGFDTVFDKKNETIRFKEQVEKEIRNNEYFKLLSSDSQDSYLESWRPSWNDIGRKTILSKWNSKNQYNILSQYGHNSFTALMALNYHYQNLDKYDRDAVNTQLFEISSLFVNDIFRLFHLDSSEFTQDELSILGEFAYLAKCNPRDVK